MNRCLICYQFLPDGTNEYHKSCSKRLFGEPLPPEMPYAFADLESLAREVIQSQTSVTGVQAKLSLHITAGEQDSTKKKFTIVGLWGGYILKPPSAMYPQLPEVEDLTMHLAQIAKIKTAPHGLLRMKSGHLAYLTKRMDRVRKKKLAMEDMCQLTERLTEDKYHGSHEQIARTILKYSVFPGLDVVNFFELVLFSFITGNADMHLKNFSLLDQAGIGLTLSPAYDLVNTKLVNPADKEELALTLNGKKNKIRKTDFEAAMKTFKIELKQQENIFHKMKKSWTAWVKFIDASFLTADYKEQYKAIIQERMERIYG